MNFKIRAPYGLITRKIFPPTPDEFQGANLQKPDDIILNFTSFNLTIMGFSRLATLLILSLRACSTLAQIQVRGWIDHVAFPR